MGLPLLFSSLTLVGNPLLDIERGFARTPTTIVSLTVAGDIAGSQTFHFSPKLGDPVNLQLGLDVRPYIIGDIRGRATKIEPDKALTQRARISVTFADDPEALDFDSTVFSINTGSTFWRRLVLAQPDLVGSLLEIRRGYVASGLAFSSFPLIFKGRVEDYDFQTNTNFTIVAKDILTLHDRKTPAQISDDNLLNETAMTPTKSSASVDKGIEFTRPTTLSSKDLFPVVLEIQPQSIAFILSSASWTAATKKLTEIGAFANYSFLQGDQIFLSHASITDGLFEIFTKIDNDTIQLRDEIASSDIGSGIISDPREDIIISSISGNILTVQENFLDKSQEFDDDAAWTKSGVTVTADNAIGPFGGNAVGDRLDFAASGDTISQDSGEATGTSTFVFSVWLRGVTDTSTPMIEPPYLLTIDLIRSDLTNLGSTQVMVTADWQRFEVAQTFPGGVGTAVVRIRRTAGDGRAVFAFGGQLEKASTRNFYAPTDGTAGTAAGRGQFGTTAAAHLDNAEIAEVIAYRLHLADSGVHPVFILRDLINRGGIAVADVDQETFDREFAFEEGVQLKRARRLIIAKPRKLSEHVKEIREQALLDLWTSETGLVRTRLSFRQNLPGVQAKRITDETGVLFRSSSYKGNKESRATEVLVYYNPLPEETDPRKPEDFLKIQGVIDASVADASGPKAKFIFSKWIFRQAEALSLAGRYVSRFKRGARIASWSLDIKDSADFDLGDILELNSLDVPVKSGAAAARGTTFWQAIQKMHKRRQGMLDVQGLEFSGLRYTIVSPDEDLEAPPANFPDFPDASGDERQYGFIGDNQNRVAGALATATFTLVSASYTASTKRITETGAFTNYTFSDGDAFFPVHASAHQAFYLIDSKVDNDTIELDVAIKNVTNGITDSGDLTGLTNDTTKWRTQLVDGYYVL